MSVSDKDIGEYYRIKRLITERAKEIFVMEGEINRNYMFVEGYVNVMDDDKSPSYMLCVETEFCGYGGGSDTSVGYYPVSVLYSNKEYEKFCKERRSEKEERERNLELAKIKEKEDKIKSEKELLKKFFGKYPDEVHKLCRQQELEDRIDDGFMENPFKEEL